MPNQKGFSKIAIIIIVLILIGATVVLIGMLGYVKFVKKTTIPDKKTKEVVIPYGSSVQGFQINFPSQPEIATSDYFFLDHKGKAIAYVSTEVINGDKIVYKVTVNDIKELSFLDENGRKNYYEQVHINTRLMAGIKVTNIFFNIKNINNSNEGVEYGYVLEAGSEALLERGIGFIRDGKAWEVLILYPLSLQGQIEKIYSDFINSFILRD